MPGKSSAWCPLGASCLGISASSLPAQSADTQYWDLFSSGVRDTDSDVPVMKEVHVIVTFPQGHTRKPQGWARGHLRATAGLGLPLVVWDLPGGEGRQTTAGGWRKGWRGLQWLV